MGDTLSRSADLSHQTIRRSHKLAPIKATSLMLCRACIRISGLRVRVVDRTLQILRERQGAKTRRSHTHCASTTKSDEICRSHGRAMRVAKALAATAVDILSNASLLEEVKREFGDSELC